MLRGVQGLGGAWATHLLAWPAVNLSLLKKKKVLRMPPTSPFGSLTVAPVGQGIVFVIFEDKEWSI